MIILVFFGSLASFYFSLFHQNRKKRVCKEEKTKLNYLWKIAMGLYNWRQNLLHTFDPRQKGVEIISRYTHKHILHTLCPLLYCIYIIFTYGSPREKRMSGAQPPLWQQNACKIYTHKNSVSDPDPVGSVSFGRIRIHFRQRWSGSGYQKKIVINSLTNQPKL